MEVFEKLRRGGIDPEFQILQEERSAGFSPQAPVAKALAHSIKAVTGKAPAFQMCPGLLEIRFYAERGVSGFAYGPGLLSVAHGPNEYIG